VQRGWYDRKQRRVRDLACGDLRIYLAVEVRRVACRRCGLVKQERLAFLADNPFYSSAWPSTWGDAVGRPPSGMWPRSCGSTGTP
jgi:transposase